jgi:predicted metal-dependent hydrolase
VTGRVQDGIIFFNAQRYFDAHEYWEDAWREAGGPLRLFYQGLVQAAVAMHHFSQGNKGGGRTVMVRAIEKLEQYPPRFCGIDNAGLVVQLRRVLDEGADLYTPIITLE